MKTINLNIEGMTCGHCVMSVRKELGKLSDVIIEDVQIGNARLTIDDTKVTTERLTRAVEEAGYQLQSIR